MNKLATFALALGVSSSAALAGGYVAPVIEVAPVVAAVAQPSTDWTGFYGGIQAGSSKLKKSGSVPTPEPNPVEPVLLRSFDPIEGTSIDKSGRSYGVHIGYMRDFGSFVGGAELAYDELGGFKVDDVKLDGNMIRGKLLAGYDAGKFLPYATIGYARAKLDNYGSDNGFGYGVGVKYMATPNILIGAEWMRHEFDWKDVETDAKGDLDIDTFGINISYRF